MRRSKVTSFLQLARIDSSLTGAASIFIPLLLCGTPILESIKFSLPIFLAAITGFIANNINDIEADKINHPDRPLVTNDISIVLAAIIYFFFLAASVFSIDVLITPKNRTVYVVFLISIISYNYIVSHLPVLKNLFVAIVSTLPIYIAYISSSVMNVSFLGCAFLFFSGKELLMDVVDMAGDKGTLPWRLGSMESASIAFTLQGGSMVMLLPLINTPLRAICILVEVMLWIYFQWLWHKQSYHRIVLTGLKLQSSIGIICFA